MIKLKLTEEKPKFQQSNLNEDNTQSFGIGDASVVIEILRNRLYENKIQTLVQEYLSNARDAHREVGQTKRIQVTFPTRQDPNFKVRDFGPGITPERMSSVFVLYGASTKRATNNQTGGFGIGAKSAWSYTDSFEIITYVDGIKRLYVAEIGTHKNGALNKIMEEETTEPNGTEISIMAGTYDVHNFCSAIIRGTMFWTDEEYPEFLGFDHTLEKALQDSRKVGTARFMDTNMSGVNPGPYTVYGYNNTILIIDGIPYPMPYSSNIDELQELREESNGHFLNLFIPNGLVQVGASREKIDDSDTSKKALKQIFVAALADFHRAKAKWEETIVDSQTLISSRDLMCGFKLTSEKHIDFVHLEQGRVTLQTTRQVEGPEFEFELVGGQKEKRNVKVNQRLFAVNGVDEHESKKENFNINGKDKYYLIKSGNVRISDIKDWIASEASDDVLESGGIDLITIMAQQQEWTQDDNGKMHHEYKRNKELADELVLALERMGFKNIEEHVQKPKVEKTDKPRITGHLYRLDQYDETYLALADLEDEQPEKPWVYFVGKANHYDYNPFAQVARILRNMGEIEHAFRITEGRLKKIEGDKRFVLYSDFIKDYKPSDEAILSYLANSYVNDSYDTKPKQTALLRIKEHMTDKSHHLHKAALVLTQAKSVNDHWTLRKVIINTKSYMKGLEAMKELNDFIVKYIPFADHSIKSTETDHMKEYIEWGLARAAANNETLKLPKILIKQ